MWTLPEQQYSTFLLDWMISVLRSEYGTDGIVEVDIVFFSSVKNVLFIS